jgi:hypothetical protein
MPYRRAIRERDGANAEECGCWVWTGTYADRNGVPLVRTPEGMTTAARWIWRKERGNLPRSLVLTPACGERLCVNPHHRTPVTRQEEKYRQGVTKLNEHMALLAWKAVNRGMSDRKVAQRFGVSARTVGKIRRGEYPTLPEEIRREAPERAVD